jgi:hypothetical protein
MIRAQGCDAELPTSVQDRLECRKSSGLLALPRRRTLAVKANRLARIYTKLTTRERTRTASNRAMVKRPFGCLNLDEAYGVVAAALPQELRRLSQAASFCSVPRPAICCIPETAGTEL